jgi:hypothetical protein
VERLVRARYDAFGSTGYDARLDRYAAADAGADAYDAGTSGVGGGGGVGSGGGGGGGGQSAMAERQGLTLVPIAAQFELSFPLYNPAQLMNVSWSCSS